MSADFEAVKQIVRTHPADFQSQLDIIVNAILDGSAHPKPSDILSRFCDAWQTADSKGAICIGWLLADTSLDLGQPKISRTLAGLLRQRIDDGDDQLTPQTCRNGRRALFSTTLKARRGYLMRCGRTGRRKSRHSERLLRFCMRN
jgi:hypothetical protein